MRQRRVGPNIALPISIPDLLAKLGMDPADGNEAVRQLVRLDYIHKEGDRVQMVLNHPINTMLELGPTPKMTPDELTEFVRAQSAKPETSEKHKRLMAQAVGKDEPKTTEPRQTTGAATEGASRPRAAKKRSKKAKSKKSAE